MAFIVPELSLALVDNFTQTLLLPPYPVISWQLMRPIFWQVKDTFDRVLTDMWHAQTNPTL